MKLSTFHRTELIMFYLWCPSVSRGPRLSAINQIFIISSVIDCIIWKSKLFVHISMISLGKTMFDSNYSKNFSSKMRNSSSGIHNAVRKSTRHKIQLHLPMKIDSLLLVLMSIHRKLASSVWHSLFPEWKKNIEENSILQRKT